MATKKHTPKKVAAKKVVVTKTKPAKKQVGKSTIKKPVKKAVAKATPKKPVKSKPVVSKKANSVHKKKVEAKKSSSIKKNTKKEIKVVLKPNNNKKVKVQDMKKTPKTAQSTHAKSSAKVPKSAEVVKPVKVPKINTKKSIPYKPDYTSLEDRMEPVKPVEPMVRYSDTDLNEFKELITKKVEAAKKELAYLQGLITRKDELGNDEAESRYVSMEDGGMSMEREQLSQMAARQISYIDHLEKALIRIENKTYGICRVTGKLIDKARLRAVPHATLSLEAKLGLVKTTGE